MYCYDEIPAAIGSFALQAILYEAACYPAPGLVSPVSDGAHEDMNYFTFLDSSAVLGKYFALFAQQGYGNRDMKTIFADIRVTGQKAEQEMLCKTGGINTHKGMLFLMGIACAAAGKILYTKSSFCDIAGVIKEMTAGIVEEELFKRFEEKGHIEKESIQTELEKTEPAEPKTARQLSHGEAIYRKYGIDGVRGEAQRGMPTVFQYSLKFFKETSDLSINDRLIHTLIGIMAKCEDTTILYRHDGKTLERVKEKAEKLMAAGGMRSTEGRAQIEELCREFKKARISPGGSADLLGITVFFYLVEQYMEQQNMEQ